MSRNFQLTSSVDAMERESLIPPSKPSGKDTPYTGPVDRFRVVYLIFCLLGIGSLLPWNFFVTANDYFQYKLRNTSLPNFIDYMKPELQTELQSMFENYLALTAMLSNVVFNFLTALLVKRIALKTRMSVSLVIIIIMFILTNILVQTDTDLWQNEFFVITMISVVILNGASSVFSASLFGLSTFFPAAYMQAAMSGQAIGGTFAAVANILSLTSGATLTGSAFGFFLSALFVVVLSLLSYIALYYLKYSKSCIENEGRISLYVNYSEEEPDDEEVNPVSAVVETKKPMLKVTLKKLWPEAFGVFFVFMVTLVCFPGIAASIISVNYDSKSLWTSRYFSPVVCFLLFNLGDWAGRVIAGWIQAPSSRHRVALVSLCVLRVVFIPLLMLCNARPRHYLPVVFDSDVYPIVFLLLFGISNGHLCTLCMMYGPKRVDDGEGERSGVLMSFFITMGLGAGSLLSFLFVKLL